MRGCSRMTCVPHRTVYQPRGRCFTTRSNSACASFGTAVSRISLVTPAKPLDHCCSRRKTGRDMLSLRLVDFDPHGHEAPLFVAVHAADTPRAAILSCDPWPRMSP